MDLDSRLILKEKLSPYLPLGSEHLICEWIVEEGVRVKLTKTRHTKRGDYSSPHDGKGHVITINHDLNRYEFLITLVHEFAHMRAYKMYSRQFRMKQVRPHGVEWKNEFRNLMSYFMDKDIFPENLKSILYLHLENPSASSCKDAVLQRALMNYDEIQSEFVLLESIPNQTIFALRGGRMFRKLKKIKKNYHCLELKSNRIFSVSPIAEVKPLENVLNA